MTPEKIKDLLNRAKSATPDAVLVKEISQASVGVSQEIAKRGLERDRAWKTATDITQDAETVKAARAIHIDAEFMIATLESAMKALGDAHDRVKDAIVAVARDESRKVVKAQQRVVLERLKNEWDQTVDQLVEMLAAADESDAAIHQHNLSHRDSLAKVNTALGRPPWVGNVGTTPLTNLNVQKIDPRQSVNREGY